MAVINYSKKEISAKIVYYGPSLCGKTTNIQSIYASIKPDQKGKLVSLATEADRTLFFDFLPIEIANIHGFKTRLHFYTVPGQVYYNSTRRAVLTGVDGVVFVADSQRDKMEENIESLNNLEENLNYYGKSIKTLPLVFQYNKRDLPDVTPVAEMEQMLNPYGYPSFEAVATTGEGVLDTLTKVTKMVLQNIEKGTSGRQSRPAPVGDRPSPDLSQRSAPAAPPRSMERPASSDLPADADMSGENGRRPGTSGALPSREAAPYSPGKPASPGMQDDFDMPEEPSPVDFGAQVSPRAPDGASLGIQRPAAEMADLKTLSLAPEAPEKALGRIQIVGMEPAETISTNALSIPLRVRIEGDTKVYRIDLAIKIDGLKT